MYPSVVRQGVVPNGDAPWTSYRDAAVARESKVKGRKGSGGGVERQWWWWGGDELVRWHSDLMPGAPKWFLPLGAPLSVLQLGSGLRARSPERVELRGPLFFSAGLNPPAAVNQSRSPVPSPSVSFYQHLNLPSSAHPLAK